VQPDKEGGFVKEKIVITLEGEELVKGLITYTYTSIRNHEFSEGCGEDDCKWCNFTKEHQQVREDTTGLLIEA
jgi:DNA helicase II / ATP-dependent DNA helicase PcrA